MQDASKTFCSVRCDEAAVNEGPADDLKTFLRNSVTSKSVPETHRITTSLTWRGRE